MLFRLIERMRGTKHKSPWDVHCTRCVSKPCDINHKCEMPDKETLGCNTRT